MSFIPGVIQKGYKAYKYAKRFNQNYQNYNYRYNPIAKFETMLPPNYRKPYRIVSRIGEAVLTGGLLYDIAKDLTDATETTGNGSSPNKLKQGNSGRNFYRSSRGSYNSRKRRCYCKRPYGRTR